MDCQILNLVENRPGALSENAIKYVAGEVLAALRDLHVHNIIHRSVDPCNVLAAINLKVALVGFETSCN
jgi:serine/threonine protein kinase